MNFNKAYEQSRGIINLVAQDAVPSKEENDQVEVEKILLENQHKSWLENPNTKSLIIFLAKRELDCLNAARNSVGKNRELTDQFLYRSKEIRKVIKYVETGREEPTSTES